MKALPFILYGGDTCQEGTKLGDESIQREIAATRFVVYNREKVAYFLFGAGTRPDKPEYPQLKELMKERFEALFPNLSTYTTDTDGWGTFDETVSLFEQLLSLHEEEIYVCSSWYHLPRIRFIWWIVARGSIKIHYVSAPSPRYRSLISEALSFAKVFYSWYKWKRKK